MPKHQNKHIEDLAKTFTTNYANNLIEVIGKPEELGLLESVAWSKAIEEIYVRLYRRTKAIDASEAQQLPLFG